MNKDIYWPIFHQHRFDDVSPTFKEACEDITSDHGFSSAWTCLALSDVIRRDIISVYPRVNGPLDMTARILDTTFSPREKAFREPVVIMWTSGSPPQKGKSWTPNHFVPLVDGPATNVQIISDEEDDAKEDDTKQDDAEDDGAQEDDAEEPIPAAFRYSWLCFSICKNVPSPCRYMVSHIFICVIMSRHRVGTWFFMHLSLQNMNLVIKLCLYINRETQEEEKLHEPPAAVHATEPQMKTTSQPNESKTETDNTLQRFLSTSQLIEAMKSSPVEKNVPLGIKENVYFSVLNQDNKERALKGQYQVWWDDCGAYVGIRGFKSYYVVTDNHTFNEVKLVNGKYTKEARKNGKKINVPLEPQPDPGCIMTLRRMYNKLKLDQNYRRRITTVLQLPTFMSDQSALMDVALYEYIGKFPGLTSHGKSKDDKGFYQRTDPRTVQKLKEEVKNTKPKNLYEAMLHKSTQDFPCGVRDVKQVQNLKYRIEKEERDDAANSNFADQVNHIISLISNGDNFIHSMIHQSGKVPSIILQTSQSIAMVKDNCCHGKQVLGVDRTFNLGDVYVTATCFKHTSLLQKRTKDHPIFVGPILIHGSCTHDVYGYLFNRFAAELPPELISNLVIGSDDEPALRRAIRETLPEATNVLCSRHIKNNLTRHLVKDVGVDEIGVRQIKSDVFGVNGLVHQQDDVQFNDAIHQLKTFVKNRNVGKVNAFISYVDNSLYDSIKYGLQVPFATRGIPLDWTNNNCESVNSMLKSFVDWKKSQLPVLINKLREIVLMQEHDVERALRGTGNYYLTAQARHYRIDPYFWGGLTSPQKRKRVDEFIKNKRRMKNMVTSSDERLQVLSSPSGGRKPGEPKQKKPKKTHTPSTQ